MFQGISVWFYLLLLLGRTHRRGSVTSIQVPLGKSRTQQQRLSACSLPRLFHRHQRRMKCDERDGIATESSDSFASSSLADIQTAAKEWMTHDPNPVTSAYVQQRLDGSESDDLTRQRECQSQLQAMFPTDGTRIAFGTSGLRASMRPGPLYMNDLVVIQAAQGIARFCEHQFRGKLDDDSEQPNPVSAIADDNDTSSSSTYKRRRKVTTNKLAVVIGYDHRSNDEFQLSSLRFALLTTLVFQKAGCFDEVLLLDGFVATPIVPYTVLRYLPATSDADASDQITTTIGIMITASHNPKDDAGYKVYWSNGCQIRSPVDQGIAASIRENLTPWMDYGQALKGHQIRTDVDDSTNSHQHTNDPCLGLSQKDRTKEITKAYFDAIVNSGLCTGQVAKWSSTDHKPPSFCYTAMHGVGHKFAVQVFDMFGLPPFSSVLVQQEPDATFPSVSFPNPEEAGALDLAKEHAATTGCDLVLANDPDADRLAVAEKDRATGEWTVFTGDQIGAMLGHWLWQTQQSAGDAAVVPAMCVSTVSSKLLAEIARVEGFYLEETLTGFKWIGSRAAELHQSPISIKSVLQSNDDQDNCAKRYNSIFCYEESIGFCCGNVIFDKDGISALGVFAELCYAVYNRGSTMREHLQSLFDRYGEFVSNNGYFFVSNPSIVLTIMDRITNQGTFDTLKMVGPYSVESIRYLGVPGYDSEQPDFKPTLPCSKSSPMLTLRFKNGCVAQFRGSGTEPKFKYYIELRGQPGVPRDVVTQELQEMSTVIINTLLEPERNGLSRTKLK